MPTMGTYKVNCPVRPLDTLKVFPGGVIAPGEAHYEIFLGNLDIDREHFVADCRQYSKHPERGHFLLYDREGWIIADVVGKFIPSVLDYQI